MSGSASPPAVRRFNLSNGVTLLRLASVPFMVWAVGQERWLVAAPLFWLAVGTDLADGRLARARGESSRLGGLLDHASDATFVAAGLAVLAAQGRIAPVLPILVVVAFVQYVLDSRWLAGRPLRASRLGRWNGVLYFVPLGIVVTREAFGLAQPADGLVAALAWGLVLSTGISIADRGLTLLQLRHAGLDRSDDGPGVGPRA